MAWCQKKSPPFATKAYFYRDNENSACRFTMCLKNLNKELVVLPVE